MEIKPHPFKRGDTLDQFDGHLLGGIGGFSSACVSGHALQEPLEVVLVQGSRAGGFHARLGDAHHHLYEGRLTKEKVSFTLEAFHTDKAGDPLFNLSKASQTLKFSVKQNLRNFIWETAQKLNLRGALLYARGVATELHVYGHTDPFHLNDKTKTFDHPTARLKKNVGIEGWGNLSFVDGQSPFVHMHGVYEANGERKGGHFIMDDALSLLSPKR
ncbi:MAG: hypothetical protein Q7T03_07575 [Deltaproteobacteria bacterium]|nr:hypothetical protein [Deltaproteobacteria bacterium]